MPRKGLSRVISALFLRTQGNALLPLSSKRLNVCLSRFIWCLTNSTYLDKEALSNIIESSYLLKHERKHLTSRHLALLLVHDLLFTRGGIQASDGPTKQAIMRHKTRLQAELVKLKVKQGAKSNHELATEGDPRAGR